MALEQSILKGTKKKLGLADDYDAFDVDVIDYINSAFFKLNQLGIGPSDGFQITGDDEEWTDFLGTELNLTVLNAVKSFVNLSVRLIFDPPGTSYHIQAIEDQLEELTHRLKMERELGHIQEPIMLSDVDVIFGGDA